MKIDLRLFEHWILEECKKHDKAISNVVIKTHGLNIDKPATEIIIETSLKRVGNIIFWNTGEADIWVFDEELENIDVLSSVKVNSVLDFDFTFQDFFKKLT